MSTLLDTERLLSSLYKGEKLEEETATLIADALETSIERESESLISADDQYSYLLILAVAHAYQHRRTVELFLRSHDVLCASLALETLCNRWGQTEEYLEHVVNFSLGVTWDADCDLQMSALGVIGEFLNERRSGEPAPVARDLLDLLLRSFDDETLEEEVRQKAYTALCRASGKDWEEIPSDCVRLDLVDGVDKHVLDNCRELLGAS